MTTTPAMARATETLAPSESRATKRTEYGEMSTPILLLAAKDAARAAVSAALHDPDDDVIALAIGQHEIRYSESLDGLLHCECGVKDISPGGHFVHVADAVRAAILGKEVSHG